MDLQEHSTLLLESYKRVTGGTLIQLEAGNRTAEEMLFHAPFVLLSHGPEEDPVLNYGNQAALELWEMSWEEFTGMPSRLTAEPMERSQREQLLEDSRKQGYSDGIQGIRISSSGRRFVIRNVLLWNIIDENGVYQGQAAVFSEWEAL